MDGIWQAIADLWQKLDEATRDLRAMAWAGLGDLGDRLSRVDLDLSREMSIAAVVFLALMSVLAFASALADRRVPWIGLGLACLAGLLGVWTFENHPGPWTLDTVMRAFIQLIAGVIG